MNSMFVNFLFGSIDSIIELKKPFGFRKWNSVCFAFTNDTRKLTLVGNGDVLLEETGSRKVSVPPELVNNLLIMNSWYPLLGKITQVNIWNSSLSTEKMIAWSDCKSYEAGNLLNWETSSWELTECFEDIEKDSICKKPVIL